MAAASGTSGGTATNRVGKYSLQDTLGEGAFGKVKLGIDTTSGAEYAIKIMEKTHIEAHGLTLQVRREIAVMKAMRHPNIVNLHEVLNSSKKLYMVMDLVTGGELFDAVAAEGRLGEAVARSYFQQLVEGVRYCHSRRVYHRDLKPENLLLSGDKKQLKITDFGLASIKAVNAKSELLHTVMGSPHYIAPEVITSAKDGYDGSKVDVWACAIILYGMLAGALPFDGEGTKALYRAIVHEPVEFPKHFSYDVIKLLRAMLHKDPAKRASLDEVSTYNWFKVDNEQSSDYAEADDVKRHRLKSPPTSSVSSASSGATQTGDREHGERRKRPKIGARKSRASGVSLLRKGEFSSATVSGASSPNHADQGASDQARLSSAIGSSPENLGGPSTGSVPGRSEGRHIPDSEVSPLAPQDQNGPHGGSSQSVHLRKDRQTLTVGSLQESQQSDSAQSSSATSNSDRGATGAERHTYASVRSAVKSSVAAAALSRPGSFSQKDSNIGVSPTSHNSSAATGSSSKQQRPRQGLSIKEMRSRLTTRQSQAGNMQQKSIPNRKHSSKGLGKAGSGVSRAMGLQSVGNSSRGDGGGAQTRKEMSASGNRVEISDVVPIFPLSPSSRQRFGSSSPTTSSSANENDFERAPSAAGGETTFSKQDSRKLGPSSSSTSDDASVSSANPRSLRKLQLRKSFMQDRRAPTPSSPRSPSHSHSLATTGAIGEDETPKENMNRSVSRTREASSAGNMLPASTSSRSLQEYDKISGGKYGAPGPRSVSSVGREHQNAAAGPHSSEMERVDRNLRLPSFDFRLSNSSSGSVYQPKPVLGPKVEEVRAISSASAPKEVPVDGTPSQYRKTNYSSIQPPLHNLQLSTLEAVENDTPVLEHRNTPDVTATNSQDLDMQGQPRTSFLANSEGAIRSQPEKESIGKEDNVEDPNVGENSLTSPVTPEEEISPVFDTSPRYSSIQHAPTNQAGQSAGASLTRRGGKKQSSKRLSANLSSVLFKDATKEGLLSDLPDGAQLGEEGDGVAIEEAKEEIVDTDPEGEDGGSNSKAESRGASRGENDLDGAAALDQVVPGDKDGIAKEDNEEYCEEEEEGYQEGQEYYENGAGGEWTMGVPQAILEDLYKQDHDNGYPPWYALDIDVFEDCDESENDVCGNGAHHKTYDPAATSKGLGYNSPSSFLEKMRDLLSKAPGPPIGLSLRIEKADSPTETLAQTNEKNSIRRRAESAAKFVAVPSPRSHKTAA